MPTSVAREKASRNGNGGNDLGFHLGNVIKYVLRSKYKGKELEDLKKARWYLDRLINVIEKGN